MAIFKDPIAQRRHEALGAANRMLALIESFPTLCPCPTDVFGAFGEDFDPVAFRRWILPTVNQQRMHAGLFCLSVWNRSKAAGLDGRWHFHPALASWDHEHRAAFIAFCNNPWWP